MSLEIKTFGCRLNSYESELIKKSAMEAGLTDTIIFNSCAVTSESERQLKQAIRKARRSSPNSKIIVTGCAAQINPDKYAKMAEVDLVLGNEEKTKVESYKLNTNLESERILVNDIMSVKETASHLVDTLEGKARVFLQIQNGCNHRCTFCIIPFGRGNSRSVPIGEIVTQVKTFVSNGYNEIVLTGVDITDYGKDLPGAPSLGQMVKRLLNLVPELKRLRLSSIDVAEIDEELFTIICNEPRFMPHIHLSLQSGDNMILKRMKRRHNREQIIEFCARVKAARPEVVFGADIIAGFPTETDEMFANTLKVIDEANLTWLHIFPYSERDGTPAARMPQVAKAIRKERASLLRQRGLEMVKAHYRMQVGKVHEVIVEQNNMGRSQDFSQVKLITDATPGEVIKVKIKEYSDDCLIA
jgi:threonylcarbamoyladenosine tRNA methylthiotransferase MtaB